MHAPSDRRLRGGTFLVAALCLILVSGATVFSLRLFNKENTLVRKTYETGALQWKILTDLEDVENGSRGFALTARKEFLEPYINARRGIVDLIGRLKILVETDPLRDQVSSLEQLAKKKIWVSEKVVSAVLRNEGRHSLNKLLFESKQVMDECRRILTSLEEQESRDLKLRSASLSQNSFVLLGLVVLLFTLALTYLYWSYRRVQSDIKLRDQIEMTFRGMVEGSPDAIVITGLGKILMFNSLAEKSFGYRRQEVGGRPFECLLPQRLRADYAKYRTGYVFGENPKPLEQELVGLRKDKSEFPIEISLNVLRTSQTALLSSSIRDVSRRKKEVEERYYLSSIVKSMSDAVIGTDLAGKIVSWNRGAEELYGYSANEMIGQPIFALAPHEEAGEQARFLHAIRRGQFVGPQDVTRVRKNGTSFIAQLKLSPVLNASGRPIGASGIVRDVTQVREAEQRLRKLSRVVEQTEDAVMITDRNGRVEYVNPAFERICGYSPNEIIGQSPNVLKSGAHSEAFYETLWKTILGGRPFQGLIQNRRKNGELVYLEKTITPLIDVTGKITHFVSTDKDVTDRRLAEERYQQTLQRFRDLFEYSKDGLVCATLDGTLIDVNEAYCRLTGYSRSELLAGLRYQDLTPKEYESYEAKFIRFVYERKQSVEYEKEYVRKDGSHVPILLTVFPLKDSEGNVSGFGASVKDISGIRLVDPNQLGEGVGGGITAVSPRPV